MLQGAVPMLGFGVAASETPGRWPHEEDSTDSVSKGADQMLVSDTGGHRLVHRGRTITPAAGRLGQQTEESGHPPERALIRIP
jgi:hypothetical protein